MLEAEASKQDSAGRFSGLRLVTAPNLLPASGRKNRSQWLIDFRSLADYSSGPATDLHRFPFLSLTSLAKGGNPVETDRNDLRILFAKSRFLVAKNSSMVAGRPLCYNPCM